MKINFKQGKSANPTEDNGFKVSYGAVKRTGYVFRWYFIVLIIISPIIGFVWYGASNMILASAKGILTTEPLSIKTIEAGTVGEIHFKPGEALKKGDLIFTIHSPLLNEQANRLRHAITSIKNEYIIKQENFSTLGEKQIQITNNNVKKQLEFEAQYNSYKGQGFIPLSDQVQLQLAKTTARLENLKAQQNLNEGKSQFLVGPVVQALLALEQNLGIIETRIKLLDIRAPHNATINEIFVQSGEYITEGEELISVSSREIPVVIAYIDPTNMAYSNIGQKVTVTLPNGENYTASIKEPTRVTNKIPAILASPFDGSKPALKVILSLQDPVENAIEGLPVKIQFPYIDQYNNFIGAKKQ